VLITRYFTEQELEEKTLQVPYSCMMLTKAGVEVILKDADELRDVCVQMQLGMALEHMVKLYDETYLVLDSESMTCHVRKYFYTPAGEQKPTRMGVAIRAEELQAIYGKLPMMIRELRDD